MRKATLEDVKEIQKIIKEFAKKDLMLPRSLNEIYENIRDFWVEEEKGQLIGCCALHPLWEDMAEIKSLAVVSKRQKRGLGEKMVRACLEECKSLKVKRVIALTFVPEFFERFGFKREKKEKMPHKIWSECIKCPHFPDCGEVLVIKKI